MVEDRVSPAPGVTLRDMSKVTGMGPSAEVISLCRWAAWRWAGALAVLLRAASPERAVRGLPDLAAPGTHGSLPAASSLPPRRGGCGPGPVLDSATVQAALGGGVSVTRTAPSAETMPLLDEAVRMGTGGSVLVLAPRLAEARRLAEEIGRRNNPVALMPEGWARAAAGSCVVVGARGAAFAPAPDLRAAVVLDAHDEAYREERSPTWHASAVVAERARRAGAPCALVSPCPTLELQAEGREVLTSRAAERSGWPLCEVVDLTRQDPRAGMLTDRVARLAETATAGAPVRFVLNRHGRAALLACARCRELARCERCKAAVRQGSAAELRCPLCGTVRPAVCAECGSTRLRNVRRGVTRVVEELAALADRHVEEVTAGSGPRGLGELAVGTEAILNRTGRAAAVVFLDFDRELLSPTFRASERALALLARAARVVGGREGGGRLVVQTRLPRHEVIDAVVHADPGRLSRSEAKVRAELRLPPSFAVALLSGAGAPEMAAAIAALGAAEVTGPDNGRFLVRAPTHAALCDALSEAGRPSERVRVEVDPREV